MPNLLAIQPMRIFRAIVTAVIVAAACSPLTAGDSSVIDDGWRRTKDGWENIADWHLPPEYLQQLTGAEPRTFPALLPAERQPWLQVHPLAIAGGILLLAGIALFGPTALPADLSPATESA